MTNGTGMDIFKAFNDLSRMDKEDFARYVVNNLANRSRERLLFYLAADFLEFIQGNNDFTTKQIPLHDVDRQFRGIVCASESLEETACGVKER